MARAQNTAPLKIAAAVVVVVVVVLAQYRLDVTWDGGAFRLEPAKSGGQ